MVRWFNCREGKNDDAKEVFEGLKIERVLVIAIIMFEVFEEQSKLSTRTEKTFFYICYSNLLFELSILLECWLFFINEYYAFNL